MMNKEDMPGYTQYAGACGLTSLLMAIQPESNGISEVLNHFWNMISPLFKDKSRGKEYNWQRVLEWLLFQSVIDSKLIELLKLGFGDALNDYLLPVLLYRINDVSRGRKKLEKIGDTYTEEDLVPQLDGSWIMRRVNVWKMDFELEILAYLFGSTFIPWSAHDGTGAVFFSKNEKKYNEKVEFLTPYINQRGPVLCCASFHWLAVKHIREVETKNDFLVRYNDPATGYESSRWLSSFPEAYRFYAFQFDEKILNKNKQLLMDIDFKI